MSTSPKILNIGADEALVELLRRADSEDVSALVTLITDNGAGRLSLSAVVREVLLKARDEGTFFDGELRLLVRELQLFGGNSLKNLTRGSGLSYHEIAGDVLKHLSGDAASDIKSTADTELKVLTGILSRFWSSSDANGQRKIAATVGLPSKDVTPHLDEVLGAVLKGGSAAVSAATLVHEFEEASISRVSNAVSSQVKKLARNPGSFLVAVAARAVPVAGAAGAIGWGTKQLAGEAYRITVPCVVRIASIRQKDLLKAKAESAKQTSMMASQGDHQVVSAEGTRWHIGTEVDRPIVSTSILLGDHWKQHARAIDGKHGAAIDRLAPILQAMPGLGAAIQQNGSEYLRVVVNGPLAKAADGDGLRGWVHDGKRFTEQARFYEDPKLQNIVNSAAIFNVASAVVAQKHLADINERLEVIELGVAAIHNFLKDARFSAISGALLYLRQIAGPVMTGAQTPAIRQKLEDFEVSLGSIQFHLESDIRELHESVVTMKEPRIPGAVGMLAALQAPQPKFLELIDQWTLCLAARMAACQLVSAFPGEESTVQARQRDLSASVDSFSAEKGIAENVMSSMTEKNQKMTSVFESKSESYARQLSLERWQKKALQPTLQNVRKQVRTADAFLTFQEPSATVLALRMGPKGRFEAYHLDQEYIHTFT